MYQITWTEFSKKDYQALDGSQKLLVDKSLERIRQKGMQAGQPLKGPLKGCNKLKHLKEGLRVIFAEVDNQIHIIQIIDIGKRSDSHVYKSTVERIVNKINK